VSINLFKNQKKPVVLVVMDGVGIAPPGPGNAVTLAKTPNLDKYWPHNPHGSLEASGVHVGLPNGVDGNSEVGHMTLGAGKIIWQDLQRINKSIENNSFFDNPKLIDAFKYAKENDSNLHLMGLVGKGRVHSSVEHLYALIDLAKKQDFDPDRLFIHAFTDGRDSEVDEAINILEKIEEYCVTKRMGVIASIIGRAIAMDRNKNWEKTRKAYEMLVDGKAKKIKSWKHYLKLQYNQKVSDEYIPAAIIENKDQKFTKISDNDSVIFFNYRPDRAQQLTRAFIDDSFPGWQRDMIKNIYFVGFSDYKKGFPKNIAFPEEPVSNPLGKVLSDNKMHQLRLAESEKFPHVTYFFNGGNGHIFENEKWLEVPSPKDVATYDQEPEMSQKWMTDVFIEKLSEKVYDFVLINFAAPDMVGHTGNLDASIKAMETVDECIGRIVEGVLEQEGSVIITADHGNAEELINIESGEPDTKHSTAQVPILIIGNDLKETELPRGGLADVAPTVLKLFGIPKPAEMTGKSLL